MLAAIVPVCRSSLEMGRRAGAIAPARRSWGITQLLRKCRKCVEEGLQGCKLHLGVRNQRDETAGVVCQRSGTNALEICSTWSDGILDLHFDCIKCCLGALAFRCVFSCCSNVRMDVCIAASAVRSASVSTIPRGNTIPRETALYVASFRAVFRSAVKVVRFLPAALSAFTLSRISLAVSLICLYNAFSVRRFALSAGIRIRFALTDCPGATVFVSAYTAGTVINAPIPTTTARIMLMSSIVLLVMCTSKTRELFPIAPIGL